MSVFINCLLRAHNLLTGGGYDPPDCCGDFDGGGPDEPPDDGGGQCNYSEACYSYCIRDTEDSIGTTTIGSLCVNSDELKAEGEITDDDCTGPNNTYVFPDVVPDGSEVGQYIANLLPPDTPLARKGSLGDGECETFNCDAGFCPDNTTVECSEGNGCQTVPDFVTGIFKCSPFMPPGLCHNNCEGYYGAGNQPVGPGGNYYRTAQECIDSGECCVEPDPGTPYGPRTPPGGTPGGVAPVTPLPPCYLYLCNESTYECVRVGKSVNEWVIILGLDPSIGTGLNGNVLCGNIQAAAAGGIDTPQGTYYGGEFTCNQNCNEPPPECQVTICINYQDQVNAECQPDVSKTANEWAGILGITCPGGNCDCEDVSGALPRVVDDTKYYIGDCSECPEPIDDPECELNVCRNYLTPEAFCDTETSTVSKWAELFLLTGTSLDCDSIYNYVQNQGGVTVNGDRYTVLPCTPQSCQPTVDPNPISYLQFSQSDPFFTGSNVVMRDPEAGIVGGNPGQFMFVVDGRVPVVCSGGTTYLDVEGFDSEDNSIPISFNTVDIVNQSFGAPSFVEPVTGTNKMRVGFVSCVTSEPNSTTPLFSIKVRDTLDPPNQIEPFAYRYTINNSSNTIACPLVIDCADDGTDPWNGDGGDFGGSQPTPPPNTDRTIDSSEGILNREFAKNINLDITDPDLNNTIYRRSRKFIPETNKTYRKDLFRGRIHYALESISKIRGQRVTGATDLPYGELTFDNIEKSLVTEYYTRLVELKKTKHGRRVRNDILSSLQRHIINGTTSQISIEELRRVLFNFEDPEVQPYQGRIFESGAVTHAFQNLVPLDPNKYGSEIEKEKMRLWKTIAPDVDKHLTIVLNNGDQERVFIDQNDEFNLSLSDGSVSAATISPGDVYTTARGLQVPLQFDRNRVSTLNFKDIDKVFGMLNIENDIVLDVSSDEEHLVEKDSDLNTSRADVYVLKLNTETLEDLERPHELIRVTKATYEVLAYDDVDDWTSFNPFPFNTFYIDHEDPFFDHLEDSNNLRATFKDFSLDMYTGYNDSIPIFPRRVPWTIAIVPTDREDLQTGSSRSTFVSLSERRVVFKRNLIKKRGGLENPILDTEVVGYGQGAIPTAQTDSQVRFNFNANKIKTTVRPYRNIEETLPRKPSPVRTLLTSLESAKNSGQFIDPRGTTVPWPTILKGLSVSERKLLITEALDYKQLRSSLSLNRLATKESVKELFPKVSFVPITTPGTTVNTFVQPPAKTTKLEGEYETETPEPLP